ncbi:hypothetical protein [Streptomyces sp. NPDC048639]|uniref:hypothetical protein n=1 Tax=Streptomyces sp. NPDC048639 TaxID=3365581 RepID=UPI0037217CB4
MADAMGEHRAAQQYEKANDKRERDAKLKELQPDGKRKIPVSASDFHHHGLEQLKSMIENADPDQVDRAGDHWRAAADQLCGVDGTGGIRKSFKDAIDHALQHWHGPASEKFLDAANEVLKKIDRTYGHARNAEMSMIGTRETGRDVGIAANLRKAQATMKQIEPPGTVDRAKDKLDDGSRDDSQFHRDMANPNIDARTALELNRGNLSLSKERQVEAVIVMEELAFNYSRHRGIKPPEDPPGGDWPTEPIAATPPPPVVMPTPGGAASPKSVKPYSAGANKGIGMVQPGQSPTGSRTNGISGGIGNSPKSGSQIGTGLDGISGGGSGLGTGSGAGKLGGGGSLGAGSGNVGAGSGNGSVGLPGPVSGGMTRGGGGAGGRAGAPGMGGGPGGRTGGAKGAGGKGGLARQRGGVVGAAKGAGTGGQGGSGLHRSRGGSQAGKNTGRPGMGVPGGRGANANDEKERGKRPDYLVEDEETWTPDRNVAPKVVE